MKKYKVKQYIQMRMDKFFNDYPKVREPVVRDAYLSGGAIASLMNDEIPRDWDIFFKTQEGIYDFMKQIYSPKESKETLKGNINKTEGLTDFSLSLEDIQIIYFKTGAPPDLLSEFDFEHTRTYYDFESKELAFLGSSTRSISSRYLEFNNKCTCPTGALFRLSKLIARGWTIDAKEILKIGERIRFMAESGQDEFPLWIDGES